MTSIQRFKHREPVLSLVLFLFIAGFLGLAVIDSAYRAPFVDLAKVTVGGVIGWMTHSAR